MQENDIQPAGPLPFSSPAMPPIPGDWGSAPEDFRVEEIPAYRPEGYGEHLFVHFEKRGLTTPQAVRRLADALGVDVRHAGWAGLKDRQALTRQWASLPGADPARAAELALEGVRVLEAVPHPRKLRTGHLHGNRFHLRLHGVPDDRHDDLRRALAHLLRTGVPNYFGAQRFGRGGDNLPRARRWLVDGGRPPRKPFERKLLVSVLQAAWFNRYLAERVQDGELGQPRDGDLMRREDSGGLFVTDRLDEARRRMAAWEISPTGPMFGPRMRWPGGEAQRREEAILRRDGLEPETMARWGRLGPGTRRLVRVAPGDARLEPVAPGVVQIELTLPKGAYATVAIRELLHRDPEQLREDAARPEPR